MFNPKNIPKKRVEEFGKIKKSDLKAARAWDTRRRLRLIIKVAKMLKRHLDGLINSANFPITNTVAEGFNSKIQSIKADARGFRAFLNHRARVLFFCGKLDLYPSATH